MSNVGPHKSRVKMSSSAVINQTCTCPCGSSSVTVRAKPRARFLCHCTICQAATAQPYADDCVHWASEIVLPQNHHIEFKAHKSSPPAYSRGKCPVCGAPVVAFIHAAPFIRLAFIPSSNYPNQSALPVPKAHMFYHRRATDISDTLPKYSGYWLSQLMVSALTLLALCRSSK